MKLAGKQIVDFVASPARGHSAALIYGPDSGLALEHLRHILSALLPDTHDPFALQELSDEELKADPTRLAEECAAFSFTGGKRAVVLRDAADRHTKLVDTALGLLAPTTYLVVVAGELGPRSSLRVLFEQKKELAALPCYHDEGADLHTLLRGLLATHGLQASRDAMEYIAQHCGNDRGVTMREIEKLALYALGQTQIDLQDAQNLLNDNSDSALDEVAMAVADGHHTALNHTLQQLFNEGAQPIAVLRVAQKYFQRLYILTVAQEAGKSIDQAVAELRPPVFFRMQPILKRQARRWTRLKVAKALHSLMQAELACKSSTASPALLCAHALGEVAGLA